MMKKIGLLIGLVIVLMVVSGCTTTSTVERMAILGGIAGGVVDDDNPWRGVVIGSILGKFIGDTIEQAAEAAAKEAAAENAPVIFQRMNAERQVERIEATPVGVTADGIKVISVKHIVDGKVVKEEVKIIPPSPQ